MVRPPYYDKNGVKKGAWDEDEDKKLKACIKGFGHVVPNWRLLPIAAGLKRCGKSCRLRWMNYLKPGLNKEKFSKFDEDRIIELYYTLGTRWSKIAENFPGRTDNDIKNYWHAHIKKRISFHKDQEQSSDESSSCTTTNVSQDEAILADENTENIGPLESNADSSFNDEMIEIDLPPLIAEEELNGFGLWQNDIISDYSDAAKFLIEAAGEEFFTLGFWSSDQSMLC